MADYLSRVGADGQLVATVQAQLQEVVRWQGDWDLKTLCEEQL